MSNQYQYQSKKSSGLVQSSVSTEDEKKRGDGANASGHSHEPGATTVNMESTGPLPGVKPGGRPGFARPARRKRRPGMVVLGTFIVVAAIVFAFWKLNANTVPDVTLYNVRMQQISLDVGGGGLVFPYQQLDISYPVAERVINVLVKAGDQVFPNQSLIQLDPSQLNVQIKQASDDMAAARAYLNAVSASGTAVNIASAQQQYNLAVNRYNALVAQASSPLLHNGNLVSPMRGVVTTVDVNPGEVFAADVPLLTIMDESTVVVRVKVPLANLDLVHTGQQAIVTPSALPSTSLHGTVSAIIPQADPQTDTFEVWVSVDNTKGQLLPGMSAFAHIQTPGEALAVPRLAVFNLDYAPAVFVVRNQRAHLQPVHVVGRSVETIFINGGLTPRDQVVLVGVDSVQDGQMVHVTRVEGQAP
ncbi:MAG: efflux RND transporter periplasmic adaptor subunit [Ktedonobacteraceae bacterium]